MQLLDQYHPDLLLAPDIVFPIDRLFMRAASKRGLFTVGLMRSWDNITAKGVVQILPSKLILHTTRMKRQAIKLVRMKEEDIVVTGPPDFDDYFRPPQITREKFLEYLGIPVSRRVILFTPFFDSFIGSAVIILNTLTQALKEGRLPSDVHILVRHRPGLKEIPTSFIESHPNLTITYPCRNFFYGRRGKKERIIDWEFSTEDVNLLTHSIYYCDVMINTVSTLTIDAAACDRPIIGIRFDADSQCRPEHSITKVMDLHDHYRELERTGGIRLVKSVEELIEAINLYLKHPELDRKGRGKIRQEQIEFFDGQNGKRVADYIRETALSL